MKKFIKKSIYVIFLLLIIALAKGTVQTFFKHNNKPDFNKVSEQMNEKLPYRLDSITVLASTSYNNNVFKYNYLINTTDITEEFIDDPQYFKESMKQSLFESGICEKTKDLLKHTVKLQYDYTMTDSRHIGYFMIYPSECGYKN